MVQQELLIHLKGHPQVATGDRDDRFIINDPDAPYREPTGGGRLRRNSNSNRPTDADIYRGFRFRVVNIEGSGLCVVLDVFTSYIGRRTLSEILQRGNDLPGGAGGNGGLGRWIHDYGRRKPTVHLVRLLERTIGEVELGSGRTTYEYLRSRYPHLLGQISPGDQAVMIAYRDADIGDESKQYTAAATLLKRKFSLDSPEVRALGDKPAFPPDERSRRIETSVGYMRGALVAGQAIQIGVPVTEPTGLLPLPNLIFGLPERPTPLLADSTGAQNDRTRGSWGRRKAGTLRDHGPYSVTEFNNPFLVYPASLGEDGFLDQFLKQTQTYCTSYGSAEFEPRLSPYRDASTAQEVVAKVKGIVKNQSAGFILLALPTNLTAADHVYMGVKSGLAIPTKCFSTANLRSQVQRGGNRLTAYIEGNALAMLVENGTRPWGLADPLNYELHFGIDVARFGYGGLFGVSVLSGQSATDIRFGYKAFAGREKVPAKIMGPFLLNELERFFEMHGRGPRSILFQRDGRLLDSERQGIRGALRRFADKHPDEPNPSWLAVTVEKNTAVALRIFRNEGDRVVRAYSGTYAIQDRRTGWLVLAGAPSLRQGTPRALQVEIVDGTGEPELLPVMSDIFRLSQLNWNSPEIDISLPITLRFTDQKLERYAIEAEADEDDEWEDQDE